MVEKIMCRYCKEGIPMEMSLTHTHMVCPRCMATSPLILDPHTTSFEKDELVIAAAKRVYVPKEEK